MFFNNRDFENQIPRTSPSSSIREKFIEQNIVSTKLFSTVIFFEREREREKGTNVIKKYTRARREGEEGALFQASPSRARNPESQ